MKNVPLSEYTTYKIGGPAKYLAEARNESDIVEILGEYKTHFPNKKIFILGGGANVLFSDEGYDGLVLKISMSEIKLADEGIVEIGAGTNLEDAVNFVAENNLSGMEWAAGIPGSFGGAIRGNAGAFGGEMKDVIISVRSVAIQEPNKVIERGNKENMFGYRTSVFKSKARDEIILSGEIKLTSGKTDDIWEKMSKNLSYRKEKQPVELPSAGSTFKNIPALNISEEQKKKWKDKVKTDPMPVIPAAVLISEAGLVRRTVGGAQISEKHPNFFVNTGGATAEDVKNLIAIAKETVKEKFGIDLEEEIQIVD